MGHLPSAEWLFGLILHTILLLKPQFLTLLLCSLECYHGEACFHAAALTHSRVCISSLESLICQPHHQTGENSNKIGQAGWAWDECGYVEGPVEDLMKQIGLSSLWVRRDFAYLAQCLYVVCLLLCLVFFFNSCNCNFFFLEILLFWLFCVILLFSKFGYFAFPFQAYK